MGLAEFAEKHDTWEDPWSWYIFGYDLPMWVLQASTSWTHWQFGLNAEYSEEFEGICPSWVSVSVHFGPWGVSLRRDWHNASTA